MLILLTSMALVIGPYFLLKRKPRNTNPPIEPTGYHLAAAPKERKDFNEWGQSLPQPRNF
jgi:hypothetical protein